MILKEAFISQVDRLLFIFLKVFETGIFPTKWKSATIIPLKKISNTNSVTDLRPISLLPLPSKIILTKKLEYLEVSGKFLKLLKNYLTNRKQSTLANNIMSTTTNIVCSIPQESTVGPLMYIIYMNDVGTALEHCKYHLYADDTVLYLSGDIDVTTERVCTDLKSFKKWCDKNKLTLNIKYTKYVTFGLRSQTRKITNHPLSIDNIRIERVLISTLGLLSICI